MKDRYALFGHPVGHSQSPRIHADFAEQTGKRFSFELVDCDGPVFPATVRTFGREGGRGGNVTLPHKLAAFSLVDIRSSRAELAGAVNTLRFESDGILLGDNTDGAGLVTDLTENLGLDLAGSRILVIGAGGATQGILGPLLEQNPAELVVSARNMERAAVVAARFKGRGQIDVQSLAQADKHFDLVLNATSASLNGQVPEVNPAVIGVGTVAYDLCYGPDGHTSFTRWAKDAGAGAAVDGWGMLVEQAAESFLVWFGVRPKTDTLRLRASV